jgi:[ribosomal protein S18]-alanine N-acetyltransferase
MDYSFYKMNELCAKKIVTWQYKHPYNFYNAEGIRIQERIDCYLDPINNYYSIKNKKSELIGYCCFGPDSQVPGGDYESNSCDIGIGLDPELTGKGEGKGFFKSILDFGIEKFKPSSFRVTVAKFNSRAIHLYQNFEFSKTCEFKNKLKNTDFIVMVKQLS